MEKSSKPKINKHLECVHSLLTNCSFGSNKNKYNYGERKDCLKKLCENLR